MIMYSSSHSTFLQLEQLERRDLLTAEFVGHFDYSPGVFEAGDETILVTSSTGRSPRWSSGATADDYIVWELGESGMKPLPSRRPPELVPLGAADLIQVGQSTVRLKETNDDRFELWAETDAGHQLLQADIIVRSSCSITFSHATIGETLFFPAMDENGNAGLWRSDGTLAGTQLVKDTLLIPALTAGDQLILWGDDAESGTELWKTDGTTEGTVRITDMKPGPEDSFERNVVGLFFSELYVAHDHLYFSTGTPARYFFGQVEGTGMDLWRLPLAGNPTPRNAEVIDSLYAHIAEDEYDPRFDLVEDGKLDELDVQALVEDTLQKRFGDTNLDGAVDFTDFVQLSSNFGIENGSWSQGDFDGDGVISYEDFILLSGNFGFGISDTTGSHARFR